MPCPPPSCRPPRTAHGLSLIELLIGLAVAGLLTTLAYPGYQSVVLKLRRGEALALAGQIQLAQERHRGQQTRFATLAELGVADTSASGRYRLSEDRPGVNGYTLRLIAQGGQAADIPCQHLQLKVDGQETWWTSGQDERLDNADTLNRRCWGQ